MGSLDLLLSRKAVTNSGPFKPLLFDSNNLKFKTNEIIFKSIGLVMCCLAFYFNFSLINMFTNITKKKIYIKDMMISGCKTQFTYKEMNLIYFCQKY